MIAYLEGNIIAKEEGALILQAESVGYFVHCSKLLAESLHGVIKLFIYHHITEQSQALYGFKSAEERGFFKLLLGLSGVGPKVAMNMMQSITLADLHDIAAAEDLARLAKLPGLGAKSAEKIMLELKRKLKVPSPGDKKNKASAGPRVSGKAVVAHPLESELSVALKGLGYKDYEIRLAIDETRHSWESNTSAEDALRLALSALAA